MALVVCSKAVRAAVEAAIEEFILQGDLAETPMVLSLGVRDGVDAIESDLKDYENKHNPLRVALVAVTSDQKRVLSTRFGPAVRARLKRMRAADKAELLSALRDDEATEAPDEEAEPEPIPLPSRVIHEHCVGLLVAVPAGVTRADRIAESLHEFVLVAVRALRVLADTPGSGQLRDFFPQQDPRLVFAPNEGTRYVYSLTHKGNVVAKGGSLRHVKWSREIGGFRDPREKPRIFFDVVSTTERQEAPAGIQVPRVVLLYCGPHPPAEPREVVHPPLELK